MVTHKTKAATTRKRKKGENFANLAHGTEHILIVDDEQDIVSMMTLALEYLGYEVTIFSNPKKALCQIQKHSEKFDLVITDQAMPEMTGSELAGNLKSIAPKLPIILMSGYFEHNSEEAFDELNFDFFMKKPFTISHLSQIIRSALDD